VNANAEVKAFLAASLGHVLVDGDTGSLQSLGGQLFLLTRDEVDNGRELVDLSALLADVVDANLRV
jgi:hypothetical protein